MSNNNEPTPTARLLLSRRETASVAGVCTRTVDRMIERGLLFAIRTGPAGKGVRKLVTIASIADLLGTSPGGVTELLTGLEGRQAR